MFTVAKDEIQAWSGSRGLPPSLVLAILFCFIHRLTTGETVEETFFSGSVSSPDWEI